MNGGKIAWTTQSEYKDWHPRFVLNVGPGKTTLTIHHRGMFGYSLPFSPPQFGEPSTALKVVSKSWTNDGHTLTLTVSGRPSRDYRLNLVNGEELVNVEGASRNRAGELIVHMPAGATGAYVNQQIVFSLR